LPHRAFAVVCVFPSHVSGVETFPSPQKFDGPEHWKLQESVTGLKQLHDAEQYRPVSPP
jgi:hypothetical protein